MSYYYLAAVSFANFKGSNFNDNISAADVGNLEAWQFKGKGNTNAKQ